MAPSCKNIGGFPRLAAGFGAVFLSLFFLLKGGSAPLLLASIFFIVICTTDTLNSKIPNPANLIMLVAGFAFQFHLSGTPGLLTASTGLLVGFILLLFPYLLGGMGAGDVKALAALGAMIGPWQVLNVFFYTALFGGIMACLHYAFNRNLAIKALQGLKTLRTFAYTQDASLLKPDPGGERLRFPYASAIAFGFFAFVNWGSLLHLCK